LHYNINQKKERIKRKENALKTNINIKITHDYHFDNQKTSKIKDVFIRNKQNKISNNNKQEKQRIRANFFVA
jgi:hypothetical protein